MKISVLIKGEFWWRKSYGLGLGARSEDDLAYVHEYFNVKPAKAHKVANVYVGGETMVTTGPHKHRKMLMRSEGYLPSTRGDSKCVHECDPLIPARSSFDGRPARVNLAILTA